MSEIYLGKPSAKLEEWCKKNYPVGPTPEEKAKKYGVTQVYYGSGNIS